MATYIHSFYQTNSPFTHTHTNTHTLTHTLTPLTHSLNHPLTSPLAQPLFEYQTPCLLCNLILFLCTCQLILTLRLSSPLLSTSSSPLPLLVVYHTCHKDDQCPPCTELTKKMCDGGHKACTGMHTRATHVHTRTHTHIHTHSRICTQSLTCTHTNTHTHTHMHTHTHTHTHSHTHTHMHTHTHTHTHTLCACVSLCSGVQCTMLHQHRLLWACLWEGPALWTHLQQELPQGGLCV